MLKPKIAISTTEQQKSLLMGFFSLALGVWKVLSTNAALAEESVIQGEAILAALFQS